MKNSVILVVLSLISIYFISCTGDPVTKAPTPYKLPTPKYFPTDLNILDDNPLTEEGVKLGRYLFYDGRLSGRTDCDSMMSCSNCHVQKYGFASPHPDGKGIGIMGFGPETTVMPWVNLVYQKNGFGWNGGSTSIENVVLAVFLLDNEFHTTHERAVKTIESIDIYPPMFEAAFGTSEVTINRISKAIAQFMRTLISYNSKFDKYLRKEQGGSFTPSELRGMNLFMSEKADCFHCHGQAALLSTYEFSNNAKDSIFPGLHDRYAITGDPKDLGAFKTPTLRNVELRNAYMHDGRYQTLEEVVDHYSEGLVNSPSVDPLMEWIKYGGTHLTEEEKSDLIAFLKTFTDYEFINNPEFARPDDLDTGCPH